MAIIVPVIGAAWAAAKFLTMRVAFSKAAAAVGTGYVLDDQLNDGGLRGRLGKAWDTLMGKETNQVGKHQPFTGQPVKDAESESNAVLDTATGKVTRIEEKESNPLMDAINQVVNPKDGEDGMLSKAFSFFNTGENGQNDFLNARTGGVAALALGAMAAMRNWSNGKGANSGFIAPALLMATVVMGGIAAKGLWDENQPKELARYDEDATQQVTQQPQRDSITALANLDMG